MEKLKKLFSMILIVAMLFTTFLPTGSAVYASELSSEKIEAYTELSSEEKEIEVPSEEKKVETELSSEEKKVETELSSEEEEVEAEVSPEKEDVGSKSSLQEIETYSMLPLKEVNAYLVLNDYSQEEIKAMPLDKVLSLLQDSEGNYIKIDSNATVTWTHFKDDEGNVLRDEYHEIGRDETVDLSEFEYTTGYTMELVVGSGKQLDTSNVRYIVRVYLTSSVHEELGFELYEEKENGIRNKVIPSKEKSVGTTVSSIPTTSNVFTVPEHIVGREYYLGISSEADKHPKMKLDIYTFTEFINYLSQGADVAKSITSQILNLDMTVNGTGYKTVLDVTEDVGTAMDRNIYALVYTDPETGYMYSYNLQAVYVVPEMLNYDANAYVYENGQMVDAIIYKGNLAELVDENKAVEQLCLMLKDGYSSDSDYYITLDVDGLEYGESTNKHITKAVLGLYESLDEVSGEKDIKDQLFLADKETTPYGYKTSYGFDEKGVYNYFTVFYDDGTVSQVEVVILEYSDKIFASKMVPYYDAPVVGAQDPWFRVNGVKQGDKTLDTYVVENGKTINMDTLYGYGYQTIFVNDKTADLSALKPTFWFGDAERVETYAVSPITGNKQISGESVRDFSNGVAQYGTIIDDDVKNYQVTFVKKESGAKLYVNGPDERTIFLDEYFENKHDILIANIGDAPLTGINVELLNAKNVKLDDYWTVGGTNNDTLAPFTTTQVNSQYGELANLAKIRLIKDGDKSGEIEGTLKISADNQEDVYIKLNGRASNPVFITEKLDEAVKYVPYSYLVATNNMNEWNKVTFTIESGKLPEGLNLFPTTGEIYGVPQETGTFNIRLKATYSRNDYFEPSYVDLTLGVNDNTDKNVYLASDKNESSPNPDDGYTIKQHIGTQTGEYSFELETIEDTEFTSYGHYDEFTELWLNGEKLVEGTDYDSESGSTKITIKEQTFENKVNPDGTNTIAMEFRKDTNGDKKGDRDGEMNRTSQNFTIKKDQVVNNVINLINKIPNEVTLEAKTTIQSARKAYDSLNFSQKNKVTNYNRLVAAENAIKILETNAKDKAEADKVIKIINAIPNTVTLECKNDVVKARNAYNILTANQKKYVAQSYVNKLNAAEKKISELEEDEREKQKQQAEINEVITRINELSDELTLKDKKAVEATRKAYDALSDKQKEKVVNYNRLVSAEKVIKALEAQEEANEKDKVAANKVIAKIDTLPETITLDDKSAVEESRNSFDLLTDTQKQLVTNLHKLVKAEEKIKTLEFYEKANEKDKEAADEVISLIDALPENVTLADKELIESTRGAYEALTDTQKAIIINYDELVEAEVALAEAEKEDYENNKEASKITFVGRVVDKNGKFLSDYIVEIHSTVQVARTDKNGYFKFTNVEMGEHILTIKNKDGKVVATKQFSIVEGTPLSLNGDVITAEDGITFTVEIKLQDQKITFDDIKEGDKTPDNVNDNDESINIGVPNSRVETGDRANIAFWSALLLFSLFVLAIVFFQSRKRRC